MCSAASCSARRRLEPLPSARRPISGTSQMTWKVCSCASPSVRSTLYRGSERPLRLQILLQARLCILERCRGGKRGDPWLEQPLNDLLGGIQAPVQEHRAAHGFQGIRQDRLAAETAGLQLAGPQLQHFAQADLSRHFGQRLSADDPGAQAAQIAFGAVRKGKEKMPGDDEVENRVAQEFQPLVVGAGGAAVSQGGDEQLRITRLVAELLAYPTDGPVRARSCPMRKHLRRRLRSRG